MKKIFFCFKKIILSCFILYGFNYISTDFNIIIPINLFSIFVIVFLGPFGLCGLVFFKYFVLWGFYGWIKWC